MKITKIIDKTWKWTSTIFANGILTGFLLLCVCKYTTAPEESDQLELERVWQYLSAFSIYQERVPTEDVALSFTDPASLVFSIHDTLRSWTNTSNQPDYFGVYYYDLKTLEQELGLQPIKKRNQQINQTVYFDTVSDSTAYIQILQFDRTTFDELKAYSIRVSQYPNLIINLRTNPGGFIDVCQEIIELFLEKDKVYLHAEYRTESSAPDSYITVDEDWKTRNTDVNWEGKKIAVIINDSSASAAEMMTLALRDGLAPTHVSIFGQKSYGKAIGQYIFLFYASSGAGMKLTGFRFRGTSGDDLKDIYNEVGIAPDNSYPNTAPFDSIISDAISWLESDFKDNRYKKPYKRVKDYSKTWRGPKYPVCYKIIEIMDGEL